jgi:HEAT repeat protein
MRHVIVFGLLMLGMLIGVSAPELSGQVLKTEKKDPKVDPKKEAAKEPEWPKKILGKNLDQWVKEMVPLNQKDASMRDFAIKTVPLFGPDARKAASKNLIEALRNDPDINVKLTAISTVPLLGFDDRDMDDGLNALIAFIRVGTTASNHTRYEVTMALANCGPIAKRAIESLVATTLRDSSSWQNRKAACYALGRLGLPTPLPPDPIAKKDDPPKMSGPDLAAVRALADRLMLPDSSHQVRREAVQSLLLLGPPQNEPAWKHLREALTKASNDKVDPSTQIWARVCFIRTELDLIKSGDANLRAVVKFADHEEATVRLEAIQALGTIGNEAKSELGRLINLATDPSLAKIEDKTMTQAERDKLLIASMAIWSLGQMTEEQKKVLPVLDELKRHPKDIIKNAAISAYENQVRVGDPKFVPKKDPKKP